MVDLEVVPPTVLVADTEMVREDIVPGDWDLAMVVAGMQGDCRPSACRDVAGIAESKPGSRWAEDTRDEQDQTFGPYPRCTSIVNKQRSPQVLDDRLWSHTERSEPR